MFLEPWMLGLAVFMYGVCAYVSRKRGVYYGAAQILDALEKKKIIKIMDNGKIIPYQWEEKI